MKARASPALRAGLALILLAALLPLPARPDAYTIGHFARPPVDLAVIVLVLCLLPRGTATVRALLVAGLAGLTLLRLADLGMVAAFRRSFNPVLDLHLLVSGWELGAATFGAVPTALALAAAMAVFLALFAVLHWALGGLPRLARPARTGLLALAVLVLAVGAPLVLPGEVAARAARLEAAFEDEARFAAELRAEDPAAPDFAALEGRDVIVLFVESYGRAWLDAPAYRATGRARLAAAGERLKSAGLDIRSGWLASPTRGGQSWLTHAALLSGLWTSSQSRYDALIASDRRSLNRLFAEAGWRTAAVMPAITRDWPDAAWFCYDEIYTSDTLGYRGRPFGWVTMPDQYTLAALDRLTRAGPGPVMVEAALISSHAPWTPLPRILPWEAVGDGSVFDGAHRDGAPPKEVWSSPETIRAAYSRALDYTLEVVAQWVARSAGDALVVVVGDHQPAPLVAGAGTSTAVPVHMIASDRDLLARLPGPWSHGMLPADDLPERRMTEIRDMLATCFSSGGCDPAGTG